MGKLSKALDKALGGTELSAGEISVPPIPEVVGKPATVPKSAVVDEGKKILSRPRWDARLLLTTEQFSPYSEIFRRLRTSILHPQSGVSPKTILITSVTPNEGKGFVCANLGVALAESLECHALMVDCDFRRPSLAGLFGLANDTGLVDYLQGDVELSMLIRKTGQPKLSLISSGKPPRNPAELLDSQKMTALVDEIAERYHDRIVLFDSPPNLVASETSVLAQKVDGVILVVRWGYSKREHVKRFVDLVGAQKIIGTVFNGYRENKINNFLYKEEGYNYSKYYR